MKGIEETLAHRLEITFDLNIVKNRLFPTMSHLINGTAETRRNGELWKSAAVPFVSLRLIGERDRDFIPALFVCLSRTTKAVFTQIL